MSSGSAFKLYVDNVQIGSGTLGGNRSFTNVTNLAIGNYGVYGSGSSNVKVDQVRLFNRVLSAAEISSLYTET